MRPEAIATNAPLDSASRLAGLRAALRERAASFVGTLAYLAGEAELHDPMTVRPRPVEAGIRLGRGVSLTVRTGRALVRMDDGSDVWLAAGATLDLTPWGDAARTVRLAAGRVLAFVAREAARPFRTLTPAGSILVTGTAFEADASDNALRVAVLHGSVEVATSAGSVAVGQGRAVSARANEAPRVTRLAVDRERWSWLGDASLSATNEHIRPAYAAAARTLGLPPAPPTEKTQMNTTMKRFVAAVAALALLVAGGTWYLADSPPASHAAPGVAAATGGAPAGAPPEFERKMESRAQIALRMDDGTMLTLDPTKPEDVEKALASVPPERREELRKTLDKVIANHALRGGGSWNDDGAGNVGVPKNHDQIVRDVDSAVKAYKDLVAGGMSPEEAKKVIEASAADSVRRQVQAQHPNAKVEVQVGAAGGPDGEHSEVRVFVSEETTEGDGPAPVPPAPPAGGGGK